jgi:hypothetical protein
MRPHCDAEVVVRSAESSSAVGLRGRSDVRVRFAANPRPASATAALAAHLLALAVAMRTIAISIYRGQTAL